ncbi:hypothetical protein A2331_00330 [Candidatus Falkowbacteria bacterium RIFOXYB2_FULL_34_18]|uniref:Uncharacterized protein n=1 Tax=Candidatus Falkowbacteria bacterium RIFOXYD2_FULL_34_120 TaxID=1798007 RepID=A0A1F5TP07_9BACT|nr:MAG: hypothetical protein A2331_00330 [Candidatus Falkowbacteria bacterium RIFOXYB2_FULL_34_18]OGF29009.1 MAG: hypothetical protein A2500_02635 [Candidatus Falkowbacteria bacterium RIFOXYC12_FULL_34_55]OGF35974.1 MAG: hypothetical protein A2466_01690 [Candidatus Falkowbacteria bacterium RIFOXYC2_FULL_34_220]OGF38520.1 MAG: hypothetical protein A2515_07215 [Candidatus Falkowbacteria bacterium RIFOXYD12_FULL_34_57]OGF40683.1 MAG: hypothetical protein A2531_03435 [Candidatus Falkowbacteria bact
MTKKKNKDFNYKELTEKAKKNFNSLTKEERQFICSNSDCNTCPIKGKFTENCATFGIFAKRETPTFNLEKKGAA